MAQTNSIAIVRHYNVLNFSFITNYLLQTFNETTCSIISVLKQGCEIAFVPDLFAVKLINVKFTQLRTIPVVKLKIFLMKSLTCKNKNLCFVVLRLWQVFRYCRALVLCHRYFDFSIIFQPFTVNLYLVLNNWCQLYRIFTITDKEQIV